MKELKVDEKFLANRADLMDKFIAMLQKENDRMRDPTTDIFIRVMAFHHSNALLGFVDRLKDIVMNSMFLGNQLHNKIFQTEEWKNNDWDEDKIEGNPFFEQEGGDLMRKIKEMINA